uniref:small monomeric GTPase n=1 Tax=Arcella intermedia TaxID=1963864 RepID=A0A6B2L3F2_9EUKA
MRVWQSVSPDSRLYNPSYELLQYRSVHALVLLYDVTNRRSFDMLHTIWQNFLRANREPSKVVKFLVGTKKDLEGKCVVPPAEAAGLAAKLGATFAMVSAREGYANVVALFQSILQQLLPGAALGDAGTVDCPCGDPYHAAEEAQHAQSEKHQAWHASAVHKVHAARLKALQEKRIAMHKETCLQRVQVLNERNLAKARLYDELSLASKVQIVVGGVMKTLSAEEASKGWAVSFQNKSTILNPRWVYEDVDEVAFRYDGLYGGSKFLAQGEFRFDDNGRLNYIEYTVINGFEKVEGVVGRGVRRRHGEDPEREARNVEVVLRRIAVLNGGKHEEAVKLVDECFASGYMANVKCVWYLSSGREKLIQGFDDAFAAKSTILEPQIYESGVTAEKVEYKYRGLYNGASFVGFCTTIFNEKGLILSESWRIVQS